MAAYGSESSRSENAPKTAGFDPLADIADAGARYSVSNCGTSSVISFHATFEPT